MNKPYNEITFITLDSVVRRCEVLDPTIAILITLSIIGDDLVYIALSSMILFIRRELGIRLLSLVLISSFLNILLKYWLDVPRPNTYVVNLNDLPTVIKNVINMLVIGKGPSLPSGHAQISSTFWLSLALSTRRVVFYACALAIPILTSYSRVVLRMHSEVDVVVGMLIGYIISLIGYIISTKRVGHLSRVTTYLKLTILLILFIVSQLLTYPDLNLITGLLIVVWVVDTFTSPVKSSTLRKVLISIISLIIVGSAYLTTSSEIINYKVSRPLETIIVIVSAMIAFIVIPVKSNVFKLRYRLEMH
jgi:membrane-associated phospholipid phosphatase